MFLDQATIRRLYTEKESQTSEPTGCAVVKLNVPLTAAKMYLESRRTLGELNTTPGIGRPSSHKSGSVTIELSADQALNAAQEAVMKEGSSKRFLQSVVSAAVAARPFSGSSTLRIN